MLSIATQDQERDWDLQLPLIMMAYCTSIQEGTGATPCSLMFGREAHLLIDVMFGMPPGEDLLRQRMEAAYHRVRSQLCLQQRRQKNLYDRKVAGAPYCVGDLVWLHSPAIARGSSRKLHCPWQGPYKIVKVITDVIYWIQHTKQPRRRIVAMIVSNHTMDNLKVAFQHLLRQ